MKLVQLNINTKGKNMTDITKYKSIAVKLESYNKIQTIAEEKYMSISSLVRYLTDKEFDKFTQTKEANQKETLKYGGF